MDLREYKPSEELLRGAPCRAFLRMCLGRARVRDVELRRLATYPDRAEQGGAYGVLETGAAAAPPKEQIPACWDQMPKCEPDQIPACWDQKLGPNPSLLGELQIARMRAIRCSAAMWIPRLSNIRRRSCTLWRLCALQSSKRCGESRRQS